MTAPYLVAVGEWEMTIAADGIVDVPVPHHRKDDILLLAVAYRLNGTTPPSPKVDTPPGWNVTLDTPVLSQSSCARALDANRRGWVQWFWRRAPSADDEVATIIRPMSDATLATTTFGGCAMVWRNCLVSGYPFADTDDNGTTSSDNGSIPGMTPFGAERTAVGLFIGSNGTLTTSGPIVTGVNVPAWIERPQRRDFTGGGASFVMWTVETATVTPSTVTTADFTPGTLSFQYGMFGFTLIPEPDPPPETNYLTLIEPARLRLGCATEYTAFITGPDYESRIDAVGWSRIEWSRILDEISTASVTVPDHLGGAYCVAKYGGLVPWRYGLLIERDGEVVWRGPVTSVRRPSAGGDSGAYIEITAQDALVRYQKRLATRGATLDYVDVDSGEMLLDILTVQAPVDSDQWSLSVPHVTTGISATREVVARGFEMAWDIVKDLLDASIDAFVLAGSLVVLQPGTGWMTVTPLGETVRLPGPYTRTGELFYGLFTEQSFLGIPGWQMNGSAQANTAWVAAADSGQDGFRQYRSAGSSAVVALDGVLDHFEVDEVSTTPLGEELPGAAGALQLRADSVVAQRALAPAVIDEGRLSQEAPVDVANLRPGSLWALDVHDAGWGQLLQLSRLKRVVVNVTASNSGIEEDVSVTLYPPGLDAVPQAVFEEDVEFILS